MRLHRAFLTIVPMVVLTDRTPLATGHLRQVFQHPENPDYLIKVMRPDAVASRWGAGSRWYKRLPRTQHYIGYVREIKEYVAMQARLRARSAPIARMVGIVETDFGLGLISEKVRDEHGALAPTLAALYARENGFTPFIERELARFFDDLLDCNVIVGDMHAWNIVHGIDSRGGPRLVLIDGFGEKHVIPRSSMSRRFNAWNTRRLFRRMRAQLVELVPLNRSLAGA